MSPFGLFGLVQFQSTQFHVLLNSLFKVLFTFPLRYLCAIGLVVIFSLRWNLPPTSVCVSKQTYSQERLTKSSRPPHGHVTLCVASFKSGLERIDRPPLTSPPIRYISNRVARPGGFSAGLFPVPSRVLRESLLVSFPPLIKML